MTKFTIVAAEQDVPVGAAICVEVGFRKIVLAHLGDGFHAIENRCSHAGSPLNTRILYKGGQISCPVHGARFNLRTGAAMSAPAYLSVESYPVKVEGGQVLVGAKP